MLFLLNKKNIYDILQERDDNMNFITILSIIVTCILCFISLVITYYEKENKVKIEIESNNKILKRGISFINDNHNVLVLILLIFILVTSFYRLSNLPFGLHVDEAGMAYDAINLAKFGVDRYLNKFPVYLINYVAGQSAMYAYLAAILIKLFGYSTFIIRTPIALLRFILSYLSYKVVKNHSGKNKALLFLLVIATLPYFIMQSRWGLDCNLMVGFISISVYFFTNYMLNNKKSNLIFSGIFLGLSLYTYALSYIIIPIFLLLTLVYLLYIKKITIKEIVIFGIPIFILSMPLILMICVNNGLIDEIKGIITIPKLPYYRGNELSINNIGNNLYIVKSILTYDNPEFFGTALEYNALPQFGTIYYMSIPLFIIGLINTLSKIKTLIKKYSLDMIMLAWLISVLLCQLLIDYPNINKSNAIYVPIAYFITKGIEYLMKHIKYFLWIVICLISLNTVNFLIYYNNNYNNDHMYQYMFATNYIDALKYANENTNEKVYIENDITAEEYIYTFLIYKILPEKYSYTYVNFDYKNKNLTNYFYINDEIDTNSCYITNYYSDKIESLGLENLNKKEFGNINVYCN